VRDARVLVIQCVNGHHVAAVYETPDGAVVDAAVGRHSHGNRDRIDTPHGAGVPQRWTDYLAAAPFGDDDVPAWCDCGPWVLSRASMTQWITDGERRVHLESTS
jgi:hypothetical protein